MKKLIAFLSIFLIGFASCNKDEDEPKQEQPIDEPVVQTNKDKLAGTSSKTWILKSSTIDPAMVWDEFGTMVTNLYAQMDECDRDDIIAFSASNTFTMEEGATKCYSDSPQVYETGTWTFNSDESLLVMTYANGSVSNSTILELSSSTFKISYEDDFDSGTNYTVTSTYTAK